MAVKNVKIGSDGAQLVNDFPLATDWQTPPVAANGSQGLHGAGVVCQPIAVAANVTSIKVQFSEALKILDLKFAYSAGGHAGDAFTLKDAAGNTIAAIPTGSATANKLLGAQTLDTSKASVAANAIVELAITDGGNHPAGTALIYAIGNG